MIKKYEKPIHEIKLLVFDLDGTLIDSNKDITLAVNLTLARFGISPLQDSLVEKYVGTGVRDLIKLTLHDAGVTNIEDSFEIFNHFYLKHIADSTHLFPGMLDVLDYYTSTEKVILTNKMNLFVGPLISALNIKKYFSATYARDSFPTCKPDPGPLIEISKIHKIPLKNIVMIGDTDVDIIAGQKAGTLTCAVTYGFGELNSLVRLKPSAIVNYPKELITCFKDLYYE